MGRYIGPKSKKERRIGERLQLKGSRSGSAKDPFARRSYPPGLHGPKGHPRLSEYGKQLREKQKVKLIYGILERQFRRYFEKAMKSREDAGTKLMELLERRLDNVVFRSGLAVSRNQARQLINHAHFMVNGKKMSIPSYLVKKGDVVQVREKSKNCSLLKENAVAAKEKEAPEWLDVQPEDMIITVVDLPPGEAEYGIETRPIVEFYSK